MRASEFPENDSQEFESIVADPALVSTVDTDLSSARRARLRGLSTHPQRAGSLRHRSSFCVIHDERRPDLREEWFQVMAAVKSAALRVRLKVLTWQELAALLPVALQEFLDVKYGIVAPGKTPSPIGESTRILPIDSFRSSYNPRIFRLRSASASPPAKSSNARSVTRMMCSRTNSAPSAAPCSGCLMQHSHSTTAQPG